MKTIVRSNRKEEAMNHKRKKYNIVMWLCIGIIINIVNVYVLRQLHIDVTSQSGIKWLCSLDLLEIIGIWRLLYFRSDYKAELIEVTPDIRTPAPAGQGQHGAARWMTEKEKDTCFDSVIINKDTQEIEKGGLVIGKQDLRRGCEKVYFIGDTVHSLSLGATRSGKTRHEVLETIGLCGLAGNSLIITDIKRELFDFTAPFLKSMGYEVPVLDYDEMEYSDSSNELQPVIDCIDRNDVPEAIDKTWDIVSQLVGEAKGERIWNDGECAAIAAAILAVCYDNREPENHKYRNLTNVYYFLAEMCTPVGEVVPLNVYKAMIPETHPFRSIFAVAAIAPSRTRSSFFTSALLTLRLYTNPKLYNCTRKSDFRLDDFGRKKMALFIVLPEDRMTYHPIATLKIMQIYSQLSALAKQRGGVLPNMVDFICDEFGNFSKIPNLTQMLTVAAGKHIRFHLFLQDYEQLNKVYDQHVAKTIRSNCEVKVYLRSADVDTREAISKELDKYTTKAYSLNYGKGGDREHSSSSSLIGRPLLTSEEIGRIKRPWSLVMTSNYPAIMYAPDLSQWTFNERFGMGDEEHNVKLRMQRHGERQKHTIDEIQLWGIWKKYQERAEIINKKMQAKSAED